MKQKTLIFTDLDGSLLDHYSYSHAAATPLLEKLERQGIPVVPNTSKTRAELLAWRRVLNNHHPFIVENGAAVLIPEDYFSHIPEGSERLDGYWIKVFSSPRGCWLTHIFQHGSPFIGQFRAFAESSIEEIVEMTGLSEAEAKRAALREYGEPLMWLDTAEECDRFIQQLESTGARVLTGGRFLHVSGNCDKGRALLWLTAEYQRHYEGADCVTIAAGDSGNDAAMLEVADHALIIPSPVHPLPALDRAAGVTLAPAAGPEGWLRGIQSILNTLPFDPLSEAQDG